VNYVMVADNCVAMNFMCNIFFHEIPKNLNHKKGKKKIVTV